MKAHQTDELAEQLRTLSHSIEGRQGSHVARCCSLALLALAGTYPHISFHAKLRQLHFDTLTTMTEINLRAGQLPWYLQGAFRGQ